MNDRLTYQVHCQLVDVIQYFMNTTIVIKFRFYLCSMISSNARQSIVLSTSMRIDYLSYLRFYTRKACTRNKNN